MSKKMEIQNIYSLSSMQEGMLFRSLVNPEIGEYVLQSEFDIRGSIDIETFNNSFQILVNRHDILRSIFNYKKASRPLQIVLKERAVSVHSEDFRHLEYPDKLERLAAFKGTDLARGFDLTKDVLIRSAILRMDTDYCKLLLTYHHILMDGWCLGILFNELTQIYRSLKNDKELQLPHAYPYGTFINWIEQQDKEAAERYWERLLAGYEHPALLPQAETQRDTGRYDFQKYAFEFDTYTTRELTLFAQSSQVTLYVVMQTLWGALLQKYNNTTDVVFGAVVSGRPADLAGVDRMVGLFINTVPVRIRQEDGETFSGLVRKVQMQTTEGNPYEYFPLHNVQAKTALKGNLFQHIIAFENYPMHRELRGADSTNDDLGFTVDDFTIREQTNYDLNVIFVPGERMKVTMTYNAEIYSAIGVQTIEAHLRQLVREVLHNPARGLSDLEIVTAQEHSIQLSFNNRASYPERATLSELFERQAQTTPDKVAVVCGEQSLTYRDLNIRANQLAYVLRSKGAGPDKLVALLLERSAEMIVAILATLKAGSAYVPIDPGYPEKRIRYMLQDSEACLLLLESQNRQIVTDFGGSVVEIDNSEIAHAPGFDLPSVAEAHHLAYIIYTSGTTGIPKGVMIEHRNVVRLFFHEGCLFDFGSDDVWTMGHSYCFDFSVWEMYGALLYGGKLVIVPEQTVRDPQQYLKLLQTEQVTILNQTPTMFYHLIQAEEKLPQFDLRLRMVIFGGEALAPYQLKNWKARHPQVRLINMYGITETTVHVTFNELTEADIDRNLSNIGRPIPTLALYILDRNLNLLPQGVVGEMYVGGEGVGRGYLNRPELTAERFLPNPYVPGDVLYRTGDMGRWRHNWELEYLGRADHQVKIRGYRIELDEIELCLLKHNSIQGVVVLPKEGAGETAVLCAYIKANRPLQLEEVRIYMEDKLPSYMIPSLFFQVDHIPLTTNGKIDRQVLLAEKNALGTSKEESIEPTDELEQELFAIWKQVLGADHFGIHDHFFDVGGNSILLIQVHNRLDNRYPGKITIADLFAYSTISKLKEQISRLNHSELSSVNIEGLVLPSEYYAGDPSLEEGTQYRYTLSSDLHNRLARISRQEQISVSDLMQGLFAYVLSEILQTDRMPLQLIESSGILQVVIAFNSIAEFSDLFHRVADGKGKRDELYSFSHMSKARQQASSETVYPVFVEASEEDGTLNLTDFFDFGLEWRAQQGGGELFFHFDHRRLEKEKMRSIFSQYIGFLKLFAENHNGAIRK
ncbi:non-ribosomal peptide synthetase [Paenibacillus sp. NAIST15-1]|uniref:non-ribosomal peptide synthetase n=1 Tax=Paenibacillus sp. NAIST15-1 TaxID=1605994 RepID=UPI00086E3230|nr:non-ribosomal peptide synthetase [Paenibacillus sp. NAIST15-1]GAV12353.1 D-alanine--poly(Phosphoribitol) ligase, subunit 1 [Paenibacillus sp. NAIST15-1]